METLLYLLYQAAGQAPMIPLDDAAAPDVAVRQDRARGLRPRRLLRAGRLRLEYGSPKCQVKLGCWGPVVNCNVPKRGWMNGIGGCPNVGGICIGCTMPGFPDKFMPFMDEPPGGKPSPCRDRRLRPAIRALRSITNHTVNKEPKWRTTGRNSPATGYNPRTSIRSAEG
jgi:hydrogenase small subunit